MKDILLTGITPNELRKNYSNSMFLPEILDKCIVGVHLKTNSIIYEMNEVIKTKIEMEFPEGFCDEYDKSYTVAADFVLDKLCETDANIGWDELEEFVKGKTGYKNDTPPFSILHKGEINEMFKIQFNNN